MPVYVYVYTNVCVCVYIHIYVCMQIRALYTCVGHVYLRMYKHTYTPVYI